MRHIHSNLASFCVSFLAIGKVGRSIASILFSLVLVFGQSAAGQTTGKKKKNLFHADPNWGDSPEPAPKKEKKSSDELDSELDEPEQSSTKKSKPATKPAEDAADDLDLDSENANSKKKNNNDDAELSANTEPVLKDDFADQEFIDQAKALEASKATDKATALLWKNVDKLGHNGLAYLASLHLKAKDPAEALRATNLAIARNQKDFEAHWLAGRAYVQKYKDKDAAESFNKAIAANKNFLPAYNDLSDVYERGKNYYEMRIIYQDLIQMKGERIEFLSKLCEIDARDGVNDQGLEYCNKAIKKNNNIASNHVWKGLIITQSGESEKGKKELKKVAEQFAESELAQFTYAEMLREQKDFSEAQIFYEACIQADARSHRCLNGLGLSTYQLQKFDLSYGALKKACFIGGRKYAASVREALVQARKNKATEWISKLEDLAQQCAIQ